MVFHCRICPFSCLCSHCPRRRWASLAGTGPALPLVSGYSHQLADTDAPDPCSPLDGLVLRLARPAAPDRSAEERRPSSLPPHLRTHLHFVTNFLCATSGSSHNIPHPFLPGRGAFIMTRRVLGSHTQVQAQAGGRRSTHVNCFHCSLRLRLDLPGWLLPNGHTGS